MNIETAKQKKTLLKNEIYTVLLLASDCPIKRRKVIEALKKFVIPDLEAMINFVDNNAAYIRSKSAKQVYALKEKLLATNIDIANRYLANDFNSLGEAIEAAGVRDTRRIIKVKLNSPAQSIIDEVGINRAKKISIELTELLVSLVDVKQTGF